MEQATCRIDDFGPSPLAQPASVPELSEIVRKAAAENKAVYPVGGGTMLDFGLPPSKSGIAVDLRKLDRVIDYPARDMTITVQAGITVAKLQEILGKENQRLPVDVPQPERATLGGALACNVSGPRRYGFGTFRDYVIGISVVNDQGQEVKAGGRVVKNVAGYDLAKLYVGSLGTLGVITQVTLKVRPLPEKQSLLILGCEEEAVETLLEQLHQTRTRPVCLEIFSPTAAQSVRHLAGLYRTGIWMAVVGIEASGEAGSWQERQLVREMVVAVNQRPVAGFVSEADDGLWPELVGFPSWEAVRLTFKANMLPRAVATFCRQVYALPEWPLLQAHAGNGIVIGHVSGDLTLERAQAMLKVLCEAAAAAQGNVVLLRCPTEWKRALPVWGLPRNDAWLMRAIKEKLDPNRLFNPGRFVDGI